MSSKWKKFGMIYHHESSHPKMVSHASNPIAMQLDGDIFRVFFSARDNQSRSSVGAVDIDIEKRLVLKRHPEPFFEHGPIGSYYADGISIGGVYSAGGRTFMLFMGWQSPAGQHWRGDIGRLEVKSDLTLAAYDKHPLLGIDPIDRVSLSYPWVERNHDGTYQMWYGSTLTWDTGQGEMLHTINYATSEDGEQWHRHGLAVPYELGTAQAFSRPTVLQSEDHNYEMWFSYRSGNRDKYKIGYAQSESGRSWQLKLNDAGISPSDTGWDSEMIEYPFVFRHRQRTYMLYNGNDFGRQGFGIAILER